LTAPHSKALIKITTSGGSLETRDREVVARESSPIILGGGPAMKKITIRECPT
jgi:hypothetical protein